MTYTMHMRKSVHTSSCELAHTRCPESGIYFQDFYSKCPDVLEHPVLYTVLKTYSTYFIVYTLGFQAASVVLIL